MARSIGIEPRVQFNAARMSGFHPFCEWVTTIAGRHALTTRKVLGPRLKLRWIDGIRCRADLQDHGIQFQLPRRCEDALHFFTQYRHWQAWFAWPIDVGDRRDPHGAEFPRRRRSNVFRSRWYQRTTRQCEQRDPGEEYTQHRQTLRMTCLRQSSHATTNMHATNNPA